VKHRPYVTNAAKLRELLANQPELADTITKGWWVVRWPEHVKIARFNGDAHYGGPFDSSTEAGVAAGGLVEAIDVDH